MKWSFFSHLRYITLVSQMLLDLGIVTAVGKKNC